MGSRVSSPSGGGNFAVCALEFVPSMMLGATRGPLEFVEGSSRVDSVRRASLSFATNYAAMSHVEQFTEIKAQRELVAE